MVTFQKRIKYSKDSNYWSNKPQYVLCTRFFLIIRTFLTLILLQRKHREYVRVQIVREQKKCKFETHNLAPWFLTEHHPLPNKQYRLLICPLRKQFTWESWIKNSSKTFRLFCTQVFQLKSISTFLKKINFYEYLVHYIGLVVVQELGSDAILTKYTCSEIHSACCRVMFLIYKWLKIMTGLTVWA